MKPTSVLCSLLTILLPLALKPALATPGSLPLAYLSGNAGEIDPCG